MIKMFTKGKRMSQGTVWKNDVEGEIISVVIVEH